LSRQNSRTVAIYPGSFDPITAASRNDPAAVPVLAIITLRRGLKGMNAKHKKIARWTLPIWMYVSVTGVVVYWMLYQM